MFSSYRNVRVLPFKNFRQWRKKTDGGRIIPDLRMVFTPFCGGKKRTRFLAIYSQLAADRK